MALVPIAEAATRLGVPPHWIYERAAIGTFQLVGTQVDSDAVDAFKAQLLAAGHDPDAIAHGGG